MEVVMSVSAWSISVHLIINSSPHHSASAYNMHTPLLRYVTFLTRDQRLLDKVRHIRHVCSQS